MAAERADKWGDSTGSDSVAETAGMKEYPQAEQRAAESEFVWADGRAEEKELYLAA